MRFLYKILIILFLFTSACKQTKKQEKVNFSNYILPQTSYFIKVNKKEVLKKITPLFIDYYLSFSDKQFLLQLNYKYPFAINVFQNNSKIKGFVAVGETNNLDSLFNGKVYSYENKTIHETTFKKKNYYAVSLKDRVLISNQKLLLENAIRIQTEKLKTREDKSILQKGLESFDDNADFNIAIHLKKIKPDVYFQSNLKIKLQDIGDWQFYDWVDANKAIISGISFSANNSSILSSIFKDVKSEKQEFARFIPFASSENIAISFDDFALFMNGLNQTKIYAPQKIAANYPILNSLKAIDFFIENNNKALVLKMENPDDFIGEDVDKIKEINDFDIYKNSYPLLINDYFSSLFPEMELKFFALNGKYIILTETHVYLEKILNDIQNHSTLADSQLFQSLQSELPDSYHLILFKNKIDITGKPYMIQKTYQEEKNEIFTNLVLKDFKNKKQQELIVEQMLSYQLPVKANIDPQLVYNHKTKTYNIIYQDINKFLYLINMQGEQLWKREIKDKIIGKIKDIDILRNEKHQYSFVTSHHWYVVDRLGRDVENFPQYFIKKITQGLSLFDYESNRKYRFGITQTKKFKLYNNQAEKVEGFKVKIDDDIVYSPEHLRIGNKDFILIQSKSGNLYLLNRRGTVRIKVDKKFNTFRNHWGVYHKKFINIDDDNNLISIDLSGKIKQGKTGLTEEILSEVKEDMLAAVAGNKLLLNKEIKILDLGTYQRPQIYRYNKHKYIFIADIDNNKIYAFDEKGISLNKFPLAGKKVLDFKADKTGKYILVYDSFENLIVYKF